MVASTKMCVVRFLVQFLIGPPLLLFAALAVFVTPNTSYAVTNTFKNPPIYADYPDPDIIRVGEDFYFATTTFVNSPGLTILHSQDLVNWEIVSHVIPRFDGREQYDSKYGSGVFDARLMWPAESAARLSNRGFITPALISKRP